jgi:hypothetical protein
MAPKRPFNQGPAGQGDHTVAQGECLESIGFDKRIGWKKLFDLPENQELKDARGCHNILLPGDKVHVPDPERKEEEVQTGTEPHVFLRSGAKTTISFKLRRRGKPLENHPCQLTCNDEPSELSTDADGVLEGCVILVAESEAELKTGFGDLTPDWVERDYEVLIGHLDPINELSGVKGRLNNLGYNCGLPNNEEDTDMTYQLEVFQVTHGLNVTGKPDEDTRKTLLDIHEV